MGMGTPGYVMPGTMGPLDQQRQQEYMNQFNSAATAPIPGVTGPANQSTQPGMQSTWNSLNGRLLGDTWLPPDVSTVDVGKGWYEVHHGGQRVGTLRPGGNNGRFLNDTNWQMPQPQMPSLPSAQPQPGAGVAPAQPFMSNGAYGRQAMMMAGLLGNNAQTPQQPTAGYQGLLGDPKRGFRIPGGGK